MIFDLPGRDSLQRVPTMEPLRGSSAHVGELLDRCDTAEELFAALTGVAGRPRGRLEGSAIRCLGTARHRRAQGEAAAEGRTRDRGVATEGRHRDRRRRAQGGLDDDVDAILDEIDEVLEANAEDFVRLRPEGRPVSPGLTCRSRAARRPT